MALSISMCWWVAGILAGCLPLPTATLNNTQQSPMFVLAWVHSVERTVWLETWQINVENSPDAPIKQREPVLYMVQRSAQIKGSGAGIDPPENAQLREGWLVWTPQPAMQLKELSLLGTVSSSTSEFDFSRKAPWRLCVGQVFAANPLQDLSLNEVNQAGSDGAIKCNELPSSLVLKPVVTHFE